MLLALLALALIALVLAAPLIAARRRAPARRARGTARGHGAPATSSQLYDPGRERRAEQRARELLRSCVNDEEWAMYRDLGFIRVAGKHARREADRGVRRRAGLRLPGLPAQADRGLRAGQRPAADRVLRGVPRPHGGSGGRHRLPASDDVLAKWMALTSDEDRVIGRANMHLVGRQLDPARVRRDLWRLAEWERRRKVPRAASEPARQSTPRDT